MAVEKHPHGFIAEGDWRPHKTSRALLHAAQDVLQEYESHLPLTIRQIFYRLVAKAVIEKSEELYRSLSHILCLARRARMVPFDSIRDDGADLPYSLLGPTGEDDLAGGLVAAVEWFELDRQLGQRRRLLLWCEAAGMRPQLESVASPYGVEVISGGGFDSVTVKHAIARLIAEAGTPVDVLHVGDLDKAGRDIYGALAKDVAAFVPAMGGEVTFAWLAITPEQVERYRLPAAPPPPKKKKGKMHGGVQAEALAPDVLASIVESAITERLDLDTLESARRLSAKIREAAMSRLRQAGLVS